MVVDIHGIINTGRNINVQPELKISSLVYLSDSNFKIVKSNSFVVYIQYTKTIEESFYTLDGISIIVMGSCYIKNEFHCGETFSREEVLKYIFRLYNEKGEDFIHCIKGSFILIILDEKLNKSLLFNDKIGLYDFLYYKNTLGLTFSTNISAFNKIFGLNLKGDIVSIYQYFLFDYPLGDRTFLQEIKTINPGYYVKVFSNSILALNYGSYLDNLTKSQKLSWGDTLSSITGVFNSAVDTLVSQDIQICSGLTSGFDSRTNLSRLSFHSDKDILYYSWGLHQSPEIEIASKVAQKFDYNYRPVFLAEDFEKNYEKFAHQSVMLSNGKGTITRANHAYGYSILSSHSDLFFTGLMGSELLKPRNCGGYMFTQLFLDLLAVDSREKRRELLGKQFDGITFLKTQSLTNFKEIFLEKTLDYFEEYNILDEFHLRLYYFMLKDGFRNYFGHEVHTNRIYGRIVSPYADDDFIKFILSTPIPELNKSAFKKNLSSSLKGTKSYLPILKRNLPKLMEIETGRYFRPKDLDSQLMYYYLLKAVIKKKINAKKKTFDTIRWSENLINSNQHILQYHDAIFKSIILNKLSHKDIVKLYSIKYFFQYEK